MAYTNITSASIKPIENYVSKNWVLSKKTNFLKKHVIARGAYLALVPSSFVTSALDTIVGLGTGVGVFLTLGKQQKTFTIAFNHLINTDRLVAQPYAHFLKMVNPKAEFSDERCGIITYPVAGALDKKAEKFSSSNNFLKRHVASRLTYALLAISCLVTRAVDGIIGIPTATLSVLTAGKFESLNKLAYRSLKAPGIIADLFGCTLNVIDPR
ncbi:hypothetical protein [Parachlamydia sp. AcF125]|uniref:hypothetical protein n=1 Tax=Parachlamydia sp. AcF125 TaxID=2795736 RepID=UPI001BC9CD6E|nr:hypothetical protein [Parachlamydia sp. AcF125]MBS4168512.1 hypothetical protein [Parachlamydia sp. AcF125]